MVERRGALEIEELKASESADDELPELSCPGCGSDLTWDDLFLSHRICSSCRRHFQLSPRERLALLVPGEAFVPINDDLTSLSMFGAGDPAAFHASSPAQRLANTRERDSINEGVVTGIGNLGAEEAVLVLLDEHATGTSIGALATEKILLAMDLAATRQFPLIMFIAGGSAAAASSPLSLVQPTRIAAAAAKLHLAGIPTFAVLCQSASNDLAGALAGQCDLIVAEPGTRVWHRRQQGGSLDAPPVSVEAMREGGLIDDVIDREMQLPYLTTALDILCQRRSDRTTAQPPSDNSDLDSGTAASIALAMVDSRIMIRGDRATSDATNVAAGFGRVAGQTVAFLTFDRNEREVSDDLSAARKLTRGIGLASRLDIPLLVMIGRDQEVATSTAEAMAIAKLSGVLTVAPVAVIVAIVGEVRSSLARALVCGDRVFCHADVVFAIEGTHPGPGRLPGTGWNRLTAGEALHLGIIEDLIEMPVAIENRTGEHFAVSLRGVVADALLSLGTTGSRRRVTDRQQKIRTLGQSTPAGRAALRAEMIEFRDLQRNIAKSVEDWRDKWDTLRSGQPRLNLQRPDFAEFATRLRARRTEILERAGLNDRTIR